MRSTPLHPPRRRFGPRFVAKEGTGPVRDAARFALSFAMLLLIVIGAAGYFTGARYLSHQAAAEAPVAGASAYERRQHRLASILFVPWTGVTTCEERRFDNSTGRIVSEAPVDCDFLTPQSRINPPSRTVDNTVRMRAILDAFKK